MGGWRNGAARNSIVVAALVVGACAGDGTDKQAAGGAPPPIVVVKPTPEAPFDRTFSWRPVDGATSYRVVVFNSLGERSFEMRDVRTTAIAIAESVGLPPGRYSWQVVAFREGNQISESVVTPFDLK